MIRFFFLDMLTKPTPLRLDAPCVYDERTGKVLAKRDHAPIIPARCWAAAPDRTTPGGRARAQPLRPTRTRPIRPDRRENPDLLRGELDPSSGSRSRWLTDGGYARDRAIIEPQRHHRA